MGVMDFAKQSGKKIISKLMMKVMPLLIKIIPPAILIFIIICVVVGMVMVFADGGSANAADDGAGSISGTVGGEGGISLTTTMLDEATFKKALQAYYDKTGNNNFKVNFLDKVDILYNTSVANNVNPELVVVTAAKECNFNAAGGGGTYNYWGIGAYNGGSGGQNFSSFEEGIKGYADTLAEYREDGSFASTINQRYEERRNSGCDPSGYGLPGTLSGMQSVYSYLGKHEYGSSSDGGYYYMDPDRAGVTKIYSTHQEFVEECLDVDGEHAEGTATTSYEQGQYTAWQVEEKIELWNTIFGEYGTLESTGGTGGNTVANTGDGYDQSYKSSTGRTYNDYEQWKGSYSGLSYWSGTMSDSGCSVTAVATIVSGYKNGISPTNTRNRYYEGYTTMRGIFESYGLKVSSSVEPGNVKKLTSGKPALVLIRGTLKTEKGSKYYPAHYIAVLDGRNGNEVYISDPGANNNSTGGWTNVNDLMSIIGEVIYVYDK